MSRNVQEEFFGKNQYSLGERGDMSTLNDRGESVSWVAQKPANNHSCAFASLLILDYLDTKYPDAAIPRLADTGIQEMISVSRELYEMFLHENPGKALAAYDEVVALVRKVRDPLFVDGKDQSFESVYKKTAVDAIRLIAYALDKHLFERHDVLIFMTVGARTYSVIFSPPPLNNGYSFTLIDTHGRTPNTTDTHTARMQNYAIRTDSPKEIAKYVVSACRGEISNEVSADIIYFLHKEASLSSSSMGSDEDSYSSDEWGFPVDEGPSGESAYKTTPSARTGQRDDGGDDARSVGPVSISQNVLDELGQSSAEEEEEDEEGEEESGSNQEADSPVYVDEEEWSSI
jgi:hypothetical protein